MRRDQPAAPACAIVNDLCPFTSSDIILYDFAKLTDTVHEYKTKSYDGDDSTHTRPFTEGEKAQRLCSCFDSMFCGMMVRAFVLSICCSIRIYENASCAVPCVLAIESQPTYDPG